MNPRSHQMARELENIGSSETGHTCRTHDDTEGAYYVKTMARQPRIKSTGALSLAHSQGSRLPQPFVAYHDYLLVPGEAFILRMLESLGRYTPIYAGFRRVGDLQLPPDRTVLARSGRVRGLLARAALHLQPFCPSSFVHRLAQYRPAFVHAQAGTDAANASLLARALAVPLLIHLRGYDATLSETGESPLSRYARRYLKSRGNFLQSADLVVTVSEFLRRRAITAGALPDRTVTHYSGIDTSFYCPDSSVVREPIVLFAGRLVEKKGCIFLIEAMRAVEKARGTTTLIVAGDGRERQALQTAAQGLGDARFVGNASPEKVRSWMRRAAVFVAPSVVAGNGDAEGLPNVVLEAQAVGLPVIASRSGGIAEAILDGETGILVPEKAVQALASAITALLSSPERRGEIGVRAARHVRERFSLALRTPLLEALYDRVARDGLSAAPADAG